MKGREKERTRVAEGGGGNLSHLSKIIEGQENLVKLNASRNADMGVVKSWLKDVKFWFLKNNFAGF